MAERPTLIPKTIAGGLLSLTGLLVLALGGLYAVEALRFIGDTQATRGVVVEHKFTHGLNTGTRKVGSHQTKVIKMYAPIVEFEAPGGRSVKFQASWSEGDPPPIGTELGVRYRIERPEDARVSGLISLFGGAAIVGLIGLVFAGSGWLVLRR